MTTSFKFLALPSFCRQARIQKDREEVSAQQDAAMQSAQSRNIINPEPLERIDMKKQMENSNLEVAYRSGPGVQIHGVPFLTKII